MRKIRILTATLLLSVPFAVNADLLTFDFAEVGGNVVMTGAGSIDLSGIGSASCTSTSRGPEVSGAIGFVFTGPGAYCFTSATGGIADIAFGTGGITTGASVSGDVMGFWAFNDIFYTPVGYVSQSLLSSTATWAGASFASLGLTAGTYEYTVGQNTFRVRVPEPGTLGLLGLGLLLVGARRKAKA